MRPSPASLARSKPGPIVDVADLGILRRDQHQLVAEQVDARVVLDDLLLRRRSPSIRDRRRRRRRPARPARSASSARSLPHSSPTTLMPVCLVKAALMSSSAFFIEAAAKTVRVLSCAAAGDRRRAVSARESSAATAKDEAAGEHGGAPSMSRTCARKRAASGESSAGSDRPGSAVPGGRARLRRATGRYRHPSSRDAPSQSGHLRQCCQRSGCHAATPPQTGNGQQSAGDERMADADADRGRLRLHHRRRGLGRLRAGQPAVRRSEQARAAARSRRQRQLDLVSHPGRLSVRDRQSALRLDVQDRAGGGAERPQPRTIRAAR